jgi:hypothetical protein
MTINAENEAAKAASIPASPGPSREPSQDDCVACGADDSEAGPLLLSPRSAFNRMAVGLRFISGTPNSSACRPVDSARAAGRTRSSALVPEDRRFLRIAWSLQLSLLMRRAARRSHAKVLMMQSGAGPLVKPAGSARTVYGRSARDAGPGPGVIRIGHCLESNGTTGGRNGFFPSLALSAAMATRASPPISS